MKRLGGRHKRKESARLDKNATLQLTDAIRLLAADYLAAQDELRCYEVVEQVSHVHGLSPDDITSLVDVIGSTKRSQKLKKKLVLCLVPGSSVPEVSVISAISYILKPSFPVSLQVELLRWICSVYTFIDSTERLSCMYSILFPILKLDLLQPYVCDLLFKLTKEEHVLPYRIRALVDLQSEVGSHPYILALLQLYANFRPDIVIIQCKYKNAFKSHTRLQRYITDVRQVDLPSTISSQNVNIEKLILMKEITSFAHLMELLESLNGVVGISKLLNSPLRRILFSSGLPESFMKRLRMFLRIALFAERTWVFSSWEYCSRNVLLPIISDVSFELQEGIPDVCSFVASYLEAWDGHRCCDLLLDLISYWGICPFDDLLKYVLQPLYKYFCYSPVNFMCAVLACLTKMYKNWVLFEIPRLLSRKENPPSIVTKQMTVFERDIDTLNPNEQVKSLGEYIDGMCIDALQIHSDHPPVLLHQMLRFYETVLLVQQQNYFLPVLHVPSESVMCAFIFSPSPYVLSQACGLLRRYRTSVYMMKHSHEFTGMADIITNLNSYVYDVCNMLGLRAAFRVNKTTKFFQQKLPLEVEKTMHKPHECFTIYRHPAMIGLAVSFYETVNEELSPQALLMDSEPKDMFLSYLQQRGFNDIVVFLKTFIKDF